jgi:hypothetical protein
MGLWIIVILRWGSVYCEQRFCNLLVVSDYEDLSDRDKTTIEGRLDAVQEILETEDMYHAIAKCNLFAH